MESEKAFLEAGISRLKDFLNKIINVKNQKIAESQRAMAGMVEGEIESDVEEFANLFRNAADKISMDSGASMVDLYFKVADAHKQNSGILTESLPEAAPESSVLPGRSANLLRAGDETEAIYLSFPEDKLSEWKDLLEKMGIFDDPSAN